MSNRWTKRSRQSLVSSRGVILLTVLVASACLTPLAIRAQETPESSQPTVQVVHAAPAVGAVDIYVDGRLQLVGLTFAAVSDPIVVPAGERSVDVVASGRPPDEVLVEASVGLSEGTVADLTLIGPADDPRIGVYMVDLAPLPPDLSRFGAILGSFDTGPVDLAVTGGDVLFPTIEFTGATEFADVAAGTYDLEVRYGGTDIVVLAVPGTVLEAGMVYSLYIVGEAAIGELQLMPVTRPATTVALVGHPAWIQAGGCADQDPAGTVADLTIVAVSPFSGVSGHPDAAISESSFTTIGVPYGSLVDDPHAIVVAQSDDAPTASLACGEIGGTQTIDGSLVVGLRAMPGSTTAGFAVVSPNVLEPDLTDVSVFIADGLFLDSGSPEPDVDQPALPATPVAIRSGSDGGRQR